MTQKILILLCLAILFQSCGKKLEETTPQRNDITETVFAAGILEAKNTYTLKALSDGYLESIYFEAGDTLAKGDVFAVIDNKINLYDYKGSEDLYAIALQNAAPTAPLITQAKSALQLAGVKLKQEQLQENRYRELLKSNSISKLEYETVLLNYQTAQNNYESAKETYNKALLDARQSEVSNRALKEINKVSLSNNKIVALVPGKIYERLKEPGDYVRKGDQVATIGDPQQLYAKVNIDESNIGKVTLGQQAYIQLNTKKGNVYKGKVIEILPAFDAQSQSFVCKIGFEEPLDFKIVNTQLEVNIITAHRENALLIPRRFIDYNGSVQIKGNSERTKVETAIVSDQYVEIVSGLNEDTVLIAERIVTDN